MIIGPMIIIKFGNSSYVVTLPYTWIKQNNLEKGDSINVKTKKDSLVISLDRSKKLEIGHINVDEIPFDLLEVIIMSYYLKNYNVLYIEGKNLIKKIEKIKSMVSKLTSLEVVDISTNRIELRDLTDHGTLDLYAFLEKLSNMIRTAFQNLIDYKRVNYEVMNNVEKNINKICYLSFKAINHNLDFWEHPNQVKNSIQYWRLVDVFEGIGDALNRISNLFYKNKHYDEKIHKPILNELLIFFNFISNFIDLRTNLDNNLPIFLEKRKLIKSKITVENDEEGKTVFHKLANDILMNLETMVYTLIDLRSR
jgi:phosphate uptake regulator